MAAEIDRNKSGSIDVDRWGHIARPHPQYMVILL